MTRTVRSAAFSLGFALLFAGCASESGFRPWTGDDNADEPGSNDGDDGPDGDGTGGWGDWEPSKIPDIAIVLGMQNEETYAAEVVIADLRGRILDTWTPPPDEIIGSPNNILQIHPVAPGHVMVVFSGDGFWYRDKTTQGGPYELPGDGEVLPLRAWIGASSVWHGDLVNRRWTRMMHIDWETGQHVIDGTGRALPPVLWNSPWGIHVSPWQGSDHHMMVTWHEDACLPTAAQRAMVVSTDGSDTDQERFWTLDRDWDIGFSPVLMNLQTGVRNDGEEVVLTQATTDGCHETGMEHVPLVRWRVDGRPQLLAETEWGELPPMLHAPSGAALRLQRPTEERDWIMRWEGVEGATGATFQHDSAARMVAPLDPEHGAALLSLHDATTGYEELVLVAGGKDVWRIDALKQGLGERPMRFTAGTVVSIP